MIAVLAIAALGTGCESKKEELDLVRNLVNNSRAEAGLPLVRENVVLDSKADAWARKLRDACALSHSTLADGAPTNWQKLGENVGFGGDIAQVHDAYLNSPGHRANIMDPAFNQMGTAAVWGTCNGFKRVFTVQVFMKA